MSNRDYIIRSSRDAAILTASYVAGTIADNIDEYNQLLLLVQFTLGSLTSAQIKVEFSHDQITWFQEVSSVIDGGSSKDSLMEHTITATGNYTIPTQLKAKHVRVSAKGTGVVTSSSMKIDQLFSVV